MFTEEELKQLNDMMETVWRCGQVVSSTSGIKMLNLQAKVQGLVNGISNGSGGAGAGPGRDGLAGMAVLEGDEGVQGDVQGGSGEQHRGPGKAK